jgi:hypothetical protein
LVSIEQRRPLAWIAPSVAIVVALAAGATIATIFDVSDSLPGNILTSLTVHEPAREPGGFDLMIVHGPPTGVARGIQLALLVLILGSVPAAVLSAVLVALGRLTRRPWSAPWGSVFLAGLIFQVSSAGLNILLFVLFFVLGGLWGASAEEAFTYGGFLGVSSLCGAAGLRCWRALQAGVHDEPIRIAPMPSAR